MTFRNALTRKQAVKAIAGITNFDHNRVMMIAQAATNAGVDAIDIAADPELVRAVKAATTLTVFASAIEPAALVAAVDAGADAVELGNFDALYDQGVFMSGEDVLSLARTTVDAVAGRAMVSITIPGHLAIDAQVRLAQALAELGGVDVIQTEGAARRLAQEPSVAELSAEEKAQISIRNTQALAQASSIPVMAASGMAENTVADALLAGASAVGIGRAFNQMNSVEEMTEALVAIRNEVMAVASQKMAKVG